MSGGRYSRNLNNLFAGETKKNWKVICGIVLLGRIKMKERGRNRRYRITEIGSWNKRITGSFETSYGERERRKETESRFEKISNDQRSFGFFSLFFFFATCSRFRYKLVKGKKMSKQRSYPSWKRRVCGRLQFCGLAETLHQFASWVLPFFQT